MKFPVFHSIRVFAIVLLLSSVINPMIFGQSQKSEVEPHYVFPDFTKAIIKLKNGVKEERLLNYNMITEEMVYDQKGVLMALDNIAIIDTVYFGQRKFFPVSKIFYEEIVKGKVCFYEQHKCNIVPPSSSVGYGGTSQTAATTNVSSMANNAVFYKLKLSDDYQISSVSQHWVKKDGQIIRVSNERQLLKLFPDKTKEIQDFIKEKKLNVKKLNDMSQAIQYINALNP